MRGLLEGTERGEKRGEGFDAERAGLQPERNREEPRQMVTVPASLALFSHPSAQEKQDLAEWHRCPLLV